MVRSDPMELIYQLVGYPNETEWIEFKEGNADPIQIGKDISALANSAAYHGRGAAYKVWGVADATHELTGTTFDPLSKKAKGNQNLQIWLRRKLSPNANYDFQTIEGPDGKSFVVATIQAAVGQPVYFEHRAFIREGSSTTELVSASRKEAELWRRLQRADFEERVAEKDLSIDELPDLLDIDAFFELMGSRRPSSVEAALPFLAEQGLVYRQDNGRCSISNLGALLVARRIPDFPALRKRPLRVVRFAGKGNIDILDDRTFEEGYALSLPKAEAYIMSVVPAHESEDGAFRRVVRAYPQRAVRELLANAVIHQDLAVADSGPFVGIYENRLEFSNPGASLIPKERVLNAFPKTRNNNLVGILRQMDLCEEGGTGWDRAVAACEQAHMMAPRIETGEETGTRVTLYSGAGYDRMTKRERMEATYWHACLMYANSEAMSNKTLRERFGLPSDKKSLVAMSRLLRECCDEGLIKEEDKDVGARYRRYIPAWA